MSNELFYQDWPDNPSDDNITQFIIDWAKDDFAAGHPVEDFTEFSKICLDNEITPTKAFYNLYLDSLKSEDNGEDDLSDSTNESLTEGKIVRQYVHYGKDGLPDAFADTAKELAEILGVEANTISQAVRKQDRYPEYAKVTYDEDDDFSDLDMSKFED